MKSLNFISGPKQYCLTLKDVETGHISHILKLRGVVMDSAANEKINFQTFHDIVTGKNPDPIITERMTLKRKVTAIQTIPEKKSYVPVNDKGYKSSDNRIYPFGYERSDHS